MIHPQFRYFPPSAELRDEHAMWAHVDPAFLVALQAHLAARHNGLWPEFRFILRDGYIGVQVWLGAKQRTYLPGHEQCTFDRILDECRGFEGGWDAARAAAVAACGAEVRT